MHQWQKKLNSRKCYSKTTKIFREAHIEYLTLFEKIALQLTNVQLDNNVSFKSCGSLALSLYGLFCELCPRNLSQLCILPPCIQHHSVFCMYFFLQITGENCKKKNPTPWLSADWSLGTTILNIFLNISLVSRWSGNESKSWLIREKYRKVWLRVCTGVDRQSSERAIVI